MTKYGLTGQAWSQPGKKVVRIEIDFPFVGICWSASSHGCVISIAVSAQSSPGPISETGAFEKKTRVTMTRRSCLVGPTVCVLGLMSLFFISTSLLLILSNG